MHEIRSAAVIGAGVMGAGIAAQIANAGVPVLLLDISRDAAAGALERLLKIEPPAFMTPANATLVKTGSIEEDLAQIASCDWIVEAIVEKLDLKRDLYRKIAAVKGEHAIVSSNTSTIQLADLVASADAAFRRNFLITHFFNPPRYMRLLEIVAGPEAGPQSLLTMVDFADRRLGKSIVRCKDRPGFIANRLGCFWMQTAIATAFEQSLSVEDADAVMGKPFGIPRTGVFGLADLVGIDLLPHVNASLSRALESADLFHTVNTPLPLVDRMIAAGLTGRKGKGGFYRLNREHGKRKEAIDLGSGEYHPVQEARIDQTIPVLEQDTAHGRYARTVMLKTLAYAALLVGDAADDVQSIDEAMRLGYNWKWGPFELIDRIGAAKFAGLLKDNKLTIAPILQDKALYHNGSVLTQAGTYAAVERPPGIVFLVDIKRKAKPLLQNDRASLWDIGDGVACFELTTKMNTLDEGAFDLLNRSIDFVAANLKAMVIYSDAANFSAGVNLNWLLTGGRQHLEALVQLGQQSLKKLKYAPFPVVAAPAGLALGGGCELLMHCSAIQAHAESYIGLVEAGVGVLPAWDGCSELLARWQSHGRLPKGPMPAIAKTFEMISLATVSKSAAHARDLLFLRPGDAITMNRSRLLWDARARALSLVDGYRTPQPPVFVLPGEAGKTALDLNVQTYHRLGKATAHDMTVAGCVATVLTGGATDVTRTISEEQMLALERTEVMKLAGNPLTHARIEHMLKTGKPLRN